MTTSSHNALHAHFQTKLREFAMFLKSSLTCMKSHVEMDTEAKKYWVFFSLGSSVPTLESRLYLFMEDETKLMTATVKLSKEFPISNISSK